MPPDDHTTAIQGLVDGLRAGHDSARAALLERACDRLTRLARKMLKGYPTVGRFEQTDDVVQNSLIRLDRALKAVPVLTARDFFRLAATQIRRELIDLARRYSGPEGLASHQVSGIVSDATGTGPIPRPDPADETHNPSQLALWTEFHRRIEDLDDQDRELFDLLWYQGLTQAEVAAVLGISERQVGRRWINARLRLGETFSGNMPV